MVCKLNVILDIDETFLYFINKDHFPHSWGPLPEKEKAKYNYIEHKAGIFIVRPYLKEFCDYLFANCNVSLWTWSDIEYAEGIPAKLLLDNVKGRKLHHIFADEDAGTSSKLHGNSKDLNYLWYKKKLPCFAECNTILIDDLPNNSVNPSNRQNSITLKPFALFGEVKRRTDPYEDVSKDDTLLKVIEILKKAQTIANNCYEDDEKRWTNIFSPANVRSAGLESYMRTIKKQDDSTVRAIGAGDSHLFVGGAKKTRRNRKTSRKTYRKKRNMSRK
jgi:hypothetical protein